MGEGNRGELVRGTEGKEEREEGKYTLLVVLGRGRKEGE